MENEPTNEVPKVPFYSKERLQARIAEEERTKQLHRYPAQLLSELQEAENPELWLLDSVPDLLTSLEEFNLLREDVRNLVTNLQEILKYASDPTFRRLLLDEMEKALLVTNIAQGGPDPDFSTNIYGEEQRGLAFRWKLVLTKLREEVTLPTEGQGANFSSSNLSNTAAPFPKEVERSCHAFALLFRIQSKEFKRTKSNIEQYANKYDLKSNFYQDYFLKAERKEIEMTHPELIRKFLRDYPATLEMFNESQKGKVGK